MLCSREHKTNTPHLRSWAVRCRRAAGRHPELPAAAGLPGGGQRLPRGLPQRRGTQHRGRRRSAGPPPALHVRPIKPLALGSFWSQDGDIVHLAH